MSCFINAQTFSDSSPVFEIIKSRHPNGYLLFLVEVTGLEPAASCSQSRHSSQTELHLEIFVILYIQQLRISVALKLYIKAFLPLLIYIMRLPALLLYINRKSGLFLYVKLRRALPFTFPMPKHFNILVCVCQVLFVCF